jgi:hypothetical protein
VIAWLEAHRDERPVSLDEFRAGGTGEALRLRQRAHRLAALLAQADRALHALHQELIRSVSAPHSTARRRRDASK